MAGKPKNPSQLTFTDLDLSRWKEYEDVETGSLWMIPSRANGNGHRLDYHGNYVPQIATQLLTRFTRADDIVLDLFLGSGTTAIEAAHLDRRCIGVDLKEEIVEYVAGKIADSIEGERAALLCGDSASGETHAFLAECLRRWGQEHALLSVT